MSWNIRIIVLTVSILASGNLAVLMVGQQRATLTFSVYPKTAVFQDNVPRGCPTTRPPTRSFVPPAPYSDKTIPGVFWFGTKKLWTQLPTDGMWRHLPHDGSVEKPFRQKIFWWREGYDVPSEPQPMLTVTGKRLDSSASPIFADRANNGWVQRDQPFIVSAIDIPTLGCWEITGHYKDEALSFVISVAP